MNLLEGGLVKDIIELSHSPRSGHSALMGKVKRGWQNTDYIPPFGRLIAAASSTFSTSGINLHNFTNMAFNYAYS